jgi:cytochrome c-type biogenesis protein CcsB
MSDLEWLKYEVIIHWVAVVCYIVSTFLFAYSLVFKNGSSIKKALALAAIGLIPHSVALLLRWIEQGHGPYMTRYEVLSSDAWITVVLFLAFSLKWKKIQSAGLVVLPVVFFMVTVALFTNPQMVNLPPSLRSFWLVLHVGFAKLAAGSIIISLGAAILYLLKEKNNSNPRYQKLPTIEILDDYSYKFAGLGFIFWTINIIAGSIWADVSWGRYWGWDPIETWSLITWLMYGIFAHLRVFWKLRGKKSAIFLVACFAMSIFTIFILPFVAKSLHSEYFVP